MLIILELLVTIAFQVVSYRCKLLSMSLIIMSVFSLITDYLIYREKSRTINVCSSMTFATIISLYIMYANHIDGTSDGVHGTMAIGILAFYYIHLLISIFWNSFSLINIVKKDSGEFIISRKHIATHHFRLFIESVVQSVMLLILTLLFDFTYNLGMWKFTLLALVYSLVIVKLYSSTAIQLINMQRDKDREKGKNEERAKTQ